MKTTGFKPLIYFLILCIFLFLIFKIEKKPEDYKNKRIKVKGTISSRKKLMAGGFLYKIGDFYFEEEGQEGLTYGERAEIIGKVEERVINDKQRQFWLIDQSIIKISPSKNEGNFASNLINQLVISLDEKIKLVRETILTFFTNALPEPQSSLFLGIVWGIKAGFSSSFYEVLKKAGLIHLVVASGQNISLFSKVLLDWLSLLFKRKAALVITLWVILLYVMLIGAEPPLVRAALMAGFSFLGFYLGKEALGGVALFVSAFLMLLFEPGLLGSISFQLSFMATAGLVFISPRMKKIRLFGRKIFELPVLGQDLLESTSAQIATMPILFYHFGVFNPLSLVANLLVLWMIPLLMSLGVIAILVGLVFPFGGKFLVLLSWPLLTFFIKVAEFFGGL